MQPELLHVLMLAVVGAAGFVVPRAGNVVPVGNSLFNELKRHASLTSSYDKAPCATPPEGFQVEGAVNNDSTHTAAMLFRDDKARKLISSLPGTTSLTDAGTDISFGLEAYPGCAGCQVHQGFYDACKSIAPGVIKMMGEAKVKRAGYKISSTGHSLGRALVNHAYVAVKTQGTQLHRVVSFGKPRVGNQQYANFVDGLAGATDRPDKPGEFLRVTHADGGVPNLPPANGILGINAGYVHHRTEVWFTDDDAKAIFMCLGQENPDCNLGAGSVASMLHTLAILE